MVTREDVEAIRRGMATQIHRDGKAIIIRTHRNAAAYDLLEFIDQHLPAARCKDGDRCVCGGDTPAVRAGCTNWINELA